MADTGRGASERAAERRREALELRKAGATYRQIGRQLHVSGKTAYKDVQRELAVIAKERGKVAEDVLGLELERLDAMQLALSRKVGGGDDRSITTALRVMERRAALVGLDKPKEINVNVHERVEASLKDARKRKAGLSGGATV